MKCSSDLIIIIKKYKNSKDFIIEEVNKDEYEINNINDF